MINWHLETRKISSLKLNENNPRKITLEQMAHLVKSLKELGMAAKPEITIDGRVIGGHQRIEAWKKLGNKTVECNVPDRELTEEEFIQAGLKFNKIHGDWDDEILANVYEIDVLFECGFTADDLQVDCDDKPKKEKEEKTCPNCGEPIK